MKIINKIILVLTILASVLMLAPNLAAADSSTKNAIQCGINSAASGDCNTQPSGNLNSTVTSVVNVLSVLVGVAAVIMIIVAGLRFITSAGSAEGAKSARNTILYAVIGLVIVALAQLIVHFVLHTTTNATTGQNSNGSTNNSGTPAPSPGQSVPQ